MGVFWGLYNQVTMRAIMITLLTVSSLVCVAYSYSFYKMDNRDAMVGWAAATVANLSMLLSHVLKAII